MIELYNEDCLVCVKRIEDKTIDCVICDLPYFKVVYDDFDNKWVNEHEYLEWVEKKNNH